MKEIDRMTTFRTIFEQGDIISYDVPQHYRGVIPFGQKKGQAMVLSSDKELRKNTEFPMVAFIDPDAPRNQMRVRSDLVQRLGRNYWGLERVRPRAEVSQTVLRVALRDFIGAIYPSPGKFIDGCYGQSRYYYLNFDDQSRVSGRPVLAISNPNPEGIFMALKHSVTEKNPIFSCRCDYAGDIDCNTISLIDAAVFKNEKYVGQMDRPNMHDIVRTFAGLVDERIHAANCEEWGDPTYNNPRSRLVARGTEGKIGSVRM